VETIAYRSDRRKGQVELKDFLILFTTIIFLAVFVIVRFSYIGQIMNRGKAKRTIQEILVKEKQFRKDHGRYGTLDEIGFVNPFPNNAVEFLVSSLNEYSIVAKENSLFDSFGDAIPGNEYFIGYANGAIEYGKRQ